MTTVPGQVLTARDCLGGDRQVFGRSSRKGVNTTVQTTDCAEVAGHRPLAHRGDRHRPRSPPSAAPEGEERHHRGVRRNRPVPPDVSCSGPEYCERLRGREPGRDPATPARPAAPPERRDADPDDRRDLQQPSGDRSGCSEDARRRPAHSPTRNGQANPIGPSTARKGADQRLARRAGEQVGREHRDLGGSGLIAEGELARQRARGRRTTAPQRRAANVLPAHPTRPGRAARRTRVRMSPTYSSTACSEPDDRRAPGCAAKQPRVPPRSEVLLSAHDLRDAVAERAGRTSGTPGRRRRSRSAR